MSLITKAVEAKGPGLLGSEDKWSYLTVDFNAVLERLLELKRVN